MNKDNVLLEIKDLAVRFHVRSGTVYAVNGISYKLHEGEVLGVVGESGSGKSVHALSILRLLQSPPAEIVSGEVWFGGKDLLKLPEREMRAIRTGQIGWVSQAALNGLNPVMRIGDQLIEAMELHLGMTQAQARKRVIELLDLVGIPNPSQRIDNYPHEFSGGMRQRVMIALGLCCNPQLLIADEPTTALDVTIEAQIIELMMELKDKLGMTMIWITHDLGVVAGISDTIQVMYGGQIMERGPINSVFKDTRNAYTLGLLNSLPRIDRGISRLTPIEGSPPDMLGEPVGDPFAPRNPYATSRCATEIPPLRQVDDGHPEHYVAAWYDLRSIKSQGLVKNIQLDEEEVVKKSKMVGEPLVVVRDLKKHFPIESGILKRQIGAVKAVDGLSFDIYPGETLGLVGESGSGKSTTGRVILQLLPATAGSVEYEGENVLDASPRRMRTLRTKMQMIFQDPYGSLNPRMRVGQIISEPLEINNLMANYQEREEYVKQLMDRVGLNPRFINRYPHEFSGGQRQRVGVARALVMDPSFIVADEPISALDVSIQAQVVNLLQDLQEERGLAYLFIAHDLSMIRYICDRVAVMYKGKIVELATTTQLYENPVHPYTQILLSAVPIPDPEIEKTRKRLLMDPNKTYTEETSEMTEVEPGHWVAASRVKSL